MKRPRTFTLSAPIPAPRLSGAARSGEAREIASVELRLPNGDDLLLLDEYKDQQVMLRIAMIARLSGLSTAQVRKLPASDVIALCEIAMEGIDFTASFEDQ